MHLLHLEHLHRVHSLHHAGNLLGKLLALGSLGGSLLKKLTDLLGDDADVLHQLDYSDFHLAEYFAQFGFLCDYLLTDVLHEVLLFVTVLLEHHVVQNQGQKHRNGLDGFLSLLESIQNFLNLVLFLAEHGSLETDNFLGNIVGNILGWRDRLSIL